MEVAGMRWSVSGAQVRLDLRAILLNGDWNDDWDFHRRREHARRCPDFANCNLSTKPMKRTKLRIRFPKSKLLFKISENGNLK
jgi:hypothetical protein